MVFTKYKKGAGEGVTAFLMFMSFVFLANVLFFALKEFDFISDDSWIKSSIYSTLFVMGGMLVYYVFVRNIHDQGKKSAMEAQ